MVEKFGLLTCTVGAYTSELIYYLEEVKMKKILLILLIGLLLMGYLVACGNGRTTTNPAEGENVLIAVILHIDDAGVLVESAESDDIWQISDRIGFHRAELDDIGAVVGDTVVITYTDFEAETYPGRIEAINWTLLQNP